MLHRMKRKVFSLFVVTALVVVGVSGYATKSDASSAGHHKLSPEEIQMTYATTSEIITKNGVFKRVSKEVPLDGSQIAHGTKDINSSTKEVVLSYGVFLKE